MDTRGPDGPFGGPALQGNGARRLFAVAGRCGVPPRAVAVALNVTVVSPSGPGNLRVGPASFAAPTSTINFAACQTRANNAVVGLTGFPLGSLWVETDIFPGTTDLVLDVAGYFQEASFCCGPPREDARIAGRQWDASFSSGASTSRPSPRSP